MLHLGLPYKHVRYAMSHTIRVPKGRKSPDQDMALNKEVGILWAVSLAFASSEVYGYAWVCIHTLSRLIEAGRPSLNYMIPCSCSFTFAE